MTKPIWKSVHGEKSYLFIYFIQQISIEHRGHLEQIYSWLLERTRSSKVRSFAAGDVLRRVLDSRCQCCLQIDEASWQSPRRHSWGRGGRRSRRRLFRWHFFAPPHVPRSHAQLSLIHTSRSFKESDTRHSTLLGVAGSSSPAPAPGHALNWNFGIREAQWKR